MSAVETYLREVGDELDDLPADDRAGLLEDLAEHLAELDREGESPYARLGEPAAYAAELRAAAGLPPRGRPGLAWPARLADLAGHRAVREVREFVPQLRPAWWVLRGYLAVAIVALWDVDGHNDFPVPTVFGSHLLGVVTVAAAVVGSVAAGRRRFARPAAVALVGVNAVLALFAGSLLQDAGWRLASPDYVYADAGAHAPLTSPHGPVTDIRPYDRDGRPLDGVLLYDQDGRPLHASPQHWWPDGCERVLDQPRAADGVPVPHLFPQRYVLVPGQLGCFDPPRIAVPLPTFAPSPSPSPSAVPSPRAGSPAPTTPVTAPTPAPR